MKINPSAFNVGNSGVQRAKEAELSVKAKAAELKKNEENTDKVVFSGQGAQLAEVEALSKSIVSEIEKPATEERIAALQKAVEDGTYYIPTSDLADALIERWIGL